MAFYPYFVCVDSDKDPTSNVAGMVVRFCVVLMHGTGYCYASKFKERKAYRWAAEVTVCIILSSSPTIRAAFSFLRPHDSIRDIKPEYHRRGIGRAMLHCLCETLKLQRCYTAHARMFY